MKTRYLEEETIHVFAHCIDLIHKGISEGYIDHHPKCKNTGMDDPPTECHKDCLFKFLKEAGVAT